LSREARAALPGSSPALGTDGPVAPDLRRLGLPERVVDPDADVLDDLARGALVVRLHWRWSRRNNTLALARVVARPEGDGLRLHARFLPVPWLGVLPALVLGVPLAWWVDQHVAASPTDDFSMLIAMMGGAMLLACLLVPVFVYSRARAAALLAMDRLEGALRTAWRH
jgi:hypothetical protein